MHCPACSTELPDDARFCGACGHRFASAPSQSSTAPSAATAMEPRAPSFELVPADFARALEKACDKAGVARPPLAAPTDHASLFKAASEAGLTKLDVEKALHHVSFEKLPASARKAMGVVLEDDVPQQGRPLWLPLVLGINAVALLVGFGAFVLYDPTPMRPPALLKPQRGEIDMTALGAALDAFAEQAEGCYKDALAKNDQLAGDVTVTLRIDLDGKAANVALTKDELGDEAATTCIVAAAQASAYPKARKAAVDVDVPLLFSAREQ